MGTTVDPTTNTTTVTKEEVKETSTYKASKNASDCGKFPSSGEHPAGANRPVVPSVAQFKSKIMNTTSLNTPDSNEAHSVNSIPGSNTTVTLNTTNGTTVISTPSSVNTSVTYT